MDLFIKLIKSKNGLEGFPPASNWGGNNLEAVHVFQLYTCDDKTIRAKQSYYLF